MAIPKYDEMTLPILQILGDGAGHSQRNLARKRPRQKVLLKRILRKHGFLK